MSIKYLRQGLAPHKGSCYHHHHHIPGIFLCPRTHLEQMLRCAPKTCPPSGWRCSFPAVGSWLPVEFLLGVTLLKREVSCPRLNFLLQGATCTQPFSKLPVARLRPLPVYPLHLLSPASLILLWGLLLRIFSREPQSPSLGKSDCRPKLYKKSHSCPCRVHTVVERHSICT